MLVIYGDRSGKRSTCSKTLSELTGVHVRTIQKYMPIWQEERRKMLARGMDGSLAWELSDESIEAHLMDQEFLRRRLDILKIEVSDADSIADQLFELLDNVDSILHLSDVDYAKLDKLLERYIANNASKTPKMKEFLAVQKQWVEMAGIKGRMDAATAAMKAVSTEQGKAAAKEKLEELRAKRDGGRNITPPEPGEGDLSAFG